MQMVLVMTPKVEAGEERQQPRIVQAARPVSVGEIAAVAMRQPCAEGEEL